MSNCMIIGRGVPVPTEDGTIRIGSGDRYLEITSDGEARIVGANGDDAVDAVLSGLRDASSAISAMFSAQSFGVKAS